VYISTLNYYITFNEAPKIDMVTIFIEIKLQID
jgi:hypothetical protein